MGNRKHLSRPVNVAPLPEIVNAIQAERNRCATLARQMYDQASKHGMLAAMNMAQEIETLIRNQP